MSGRHKLIEMNCERCRKPFMTRLQRVKQGRGKFCSLKCANEVQKESASVSWGFENGKPYWDGKRYQIHWYDNKGVHVTSYANWWWVVNMGNVPDGHCVIYLDGDYSNISPDNFSLRLVADISRENGSKSDTTSYGFLGKTHSEESKLRMSKSRVGKKLSLEHRHSIGKSIKARWERGDFDNVDFNRDISGEKNYFWRDGSGTDYPQKFNRSLKKFIWSRDNSTCQICGVHVSSRGIVGHVHHIDGHKENLDYENLILLCQSCHTRIHKSKDITSPVIMAFREKLYWNK